MGRWWWWGGWKVKRTHRHAVVGHAPRDDLAPRGLPESIPVVPRQLDVRVVGVRTARAVKALRDVEVGGELLERRTA